MAKFSVIALGRRARRSINLPLPNGETCVVDVRVMDDADDTRVDEGAKAFALAHKGEPVAGDPHYDRGHTIHLLLRACIDHDSPEEKPEPFFDGGVGQVQTLDRDTLAYLVAHQELWQDECSPRKMTLSGEEVMAEALKIALEEDERPFVLLRPGLQWSLVRSLARHLIDSLGPKFSSGSLSESTSRSGTAASEERVA